MLPDSLGYGRLLTVARSCLWSLTSAAGFDCRSCCIYLQQQRCIRNGALYFIFGYRHWRTVTEPEKSIFRCTTRKSAT
uniref:Putative secreted protein n=1 Tax=Ixodes ricinus TaxID=34613 RepID=A0A6B0U4Y8_IXORI